VSPGVAVVVPHPVSWSLPALPVRSVRIVAFARLGTLIAGAATLIAVAAEPAQGQRYSLQLRPRAGDTLRLKMEQATEFEGTHAHERAGTSGGRSKADTTTHERTGILVFTRIAIEATDLEGADVTAITDSVRLTGDSPIAAAVEIAARAAEGRRVKLRVAPDGATMVAHDNGQAAAGLRAVVTQMPATLPKDPVEIGQSWVRTMEIPVAPAGRGLSGGSAAISGTFKLDSVGRGGDIAYVSLSGRLVRSTNLPSTGDPGSKDRRRGSRGAVVSTSGSINGQLIIDRVRGWIVDVKTSVVTRSLLQEPGYGANPARMWMKVTQRVSVY
jgi:hypothetical protein